MRPEGTLRRRWDIAPPVATLLTGVVLVVAAGLVWPSQACTPEAIAAQSATTAPPGVVHVVVLSSSNKGALLQEMACRFEETDPTVAGHPLDVSIVSEASGSAIDKINAGERQPDVWSPASTSWVSMLRSGPYQEWVPDGTPPSIAQSPQVIAMPRPSAERLGWPQARISWNDILEFATDPARWDAIADPGSGDFKLGKTNLLYSTSGLNATVATYQAATNRTSDLTLDDLAEPAVREFVKGVESAVVHYAPTSIDFLRNLRAQDEEGEGEQYVSAILLEEKSVWDYNQGNPSGDPLTLGDEAPPVSQLTAFYPNDGVLIADHPYVTLQADWVTDDEQEGAELFLRFLLEPVQQQRFQSLGYRDHTGAPGPEIDVENGLIQARPVTITPPGGDILTQIRNDWPHYRKRARVLLLMDVSGSMSSLVPGTGSTKLELAQTAALRALRQLGTDDEVGLWTFTPDSAVSKGYVENVPVGPLSSNRDQLIDAIVGLEAHGDTHLYDALQAASARMQVDFDPQRINGIILLSDGVNDPPSDTGRAHTIDAVAPPGPDREVRVFTIAYGDLADVDTLAEIARASQGTAYDATDPSSIDRVFEQVVANF